MVFKAGVPHATTNLKTWFGYWKSDGFIKTKHRGRIDVNHGWDGIRDRWVEMFRNREVHAGESVLQKVTADDEWCAEAYIETNYTVLEATKFSETVKRYVAFQLRQPSPVSVSNLFPDKQGWRVFRIDEIFDIKKGKRLTKADQTEGVTPFLGSIEDNNGVSAYIGQKPIHKGNTITVNYNGSVAEAFYQPKPFWASDDVNVLYPKFKMNAPIGLFIATVIREEKYRFNYGRKWHLERMEQSTIKLPVDAAGKLDLDYMEKYIKSLPFSSQIQ